MAAIGAVGGWERLPAAYLAMLAGGAAFASCGASVTGMLKATLVSTSAMVSAAVSTGEPSAAMMGAQCAGKFPYRVGLGLAPSSGGHLGGKGRYHDEASPVDAATPGTRR